MPEAVWTLYMIGEQHPYTLIFGLILAAIGFCLIPLIVAWLWARYISPRKPGPDKNAAYECGVESKGGPWVQFRSEYYLYGILFLIFDVEIVFLLPFAVAFKELPLGGVLAVMIFLVLLAEGLVWAWRKGVLVWR